MGTLFLDSGQGVLPFIKEILKQNVKQRFVFYLDEINFPYGNKSYKEVKGILRDNFSLFANIKDIDTVFLACNTLSSVYDNSFITDFNVEDILHFNLSHMEKDCYYLGTRLTAEYMKKNGIKTIFEPYLAEYIENGDIKNIIKTIKNKSLPHKILLGCTHYPLIKSLFMRYSKAKIYSYEDKYIATLKSKDELTIDLYTNKIAFYKKILKHECIKFYPLTYISYRGDIR